MSTTTETPEALKAHECHGPDCDRLAMPGYYCTKCGNPVCDACFPHCACLEDEEGRA